MKREVSPIVVVIGILGLLVAIQVVYWHKLGPTKGLVVGRGGSAGGGGGEGAEASAPEVPRGDARFMVSTVAGAPEPGYRDGSAAEARFDGPAGVAVAPSGLVYVADSRNDAIRSVSPVGTVITVAGGPGRHVFSAPAGIQVLGDGNLLVTDTGNHRLCEVTPGGAVTMFVGAETRRDELGRPSGGYRDGPAGQAQFRYPVGLAVGAEGAVYVADAGNHCVRRIANGVVSTIATTNGRMDTPIAVTVGLYDNLRVTDAATGCVWAGPAAGPLVRLEQNGLRKLFAAPSGLAMAVPSELGEVSLPRDYLVADSHSHCLYLIADQGVTLVAGQQGTAGLADGGGDQARFSQPAGLCAGPGGMVYVADFGNNCIRRVTLPGSSR